MQLFLEQILNGVVLGGMFALMSVGLIMIFGIMKRRSLRMAPCTCWGDMSSIGAPICFISRLLQQLSWPSQSVPRWDGGGIPRLLPT
jgi:branched-subunit amino acid ABC-type transport system permease component